MVRIGRVWIGVLLSGTIACATAAGMRGAPLQEGIAHTFTGEYDQVLTAAREALLEAGLTVEEVNKVNDTTWMIIGNRGTSAWSWGELVRLVVEQTDASQTTVRVLTERRLATNVTAKGDYSTSIFSNMELKLKSSVKPASKRPIPAASRANQEI